MIKKLFIPALIAVSFSVVALAACVSPSSKEIAKMEVTWESDSPFIEFTARQSGGLGYAIDASGETRQIYFCWNYKKSVFVIYLTNDESDLDKITVQENIALTGNYGYKSKKNKQVELEINSTKHQDKLFNGIHEKIILSVQGVIPVIS